MDLAGTSVSAAAGVAKQAHALLQGHNADGALIRHQGKLIGAAEFLAQARALAGQLPDHAYVFNLCNDRYHFILVFAAALLRGQSNLLPPNQAPLEIAALAARYPDVYCALDSPREDLALRQFCVSAPTATVPHWDVPLIDAAHLAAVVFTSGSSGESQANNKTWGELVIGSRMARARFIQAEHRGALIIATVPAQHMFGLETSVLIPLLGGLVSHAGRPFFPADLHAVLHREEQSGCGPRILVTTPLHLKACMEAGLDWPKLDLIISATAPMSAELAQAAEDAFQCPMREIYGCTEAGALASRRTVEGPLWRLYEGMQVMETGEGWQLDGPQLARPIILGDELRLESDGRFELLGRHGDMLKIAGKRASLADLNHKLTAIAGVEDGVMLAPEDDREPGRLSALVVAPTLKPADIHTALAERIDAVFLPRPVYMVEKLPRTATGKLPRRALLDLLDHVSKRPRANK